ncbi:MAG: hypothetical protein IR153_03910 [Flavobacterium sp.]|nr:hypothetical protein [Flavobacterium sp.]
MKSYKIKQSSQILFITILIVITLCGIYILNTLNDKPLPKLATFILIAAIIAISYFSARYLSTAEIEIIVNKEGIKKKWTKQFILRNRPNVKIDWNEISEYLFERDRNWSTFEIVTKTGAIFQLVHNDDYDNKDDFLKFVRNFESKVQKINSDDIPENDIIRAPTIYEGSTGVMIAIFGGVLVFGLMMSIFISVEKPKHYYGIIAACLGVSFFIQQVYSHRKRKH